MRTLTVGLIPSPDLPAEIVEKITGKLVKDFKKHIHANIEWKIETEVDPLTGTAEYVNEIVDKAAIIKRQHNWDYAISLTDLPSFSGQKAVTADVSIQRGAALVSLPSFGLFPLKKRIRKALVFVMDLLYKNEQEGTAADARFVVQSRLISWIRIVSGMTFANRPWKSLGSFKKVLTLAFATGTYISIFSTPWELSVAYSPLRFLILMLLSITGMVTWLVFAHNLWEKASSKAQSQYRIMYNITTITTLTFVAFVMYLTLYIAILLSVSLFVPADLFEGWTSVNVDNAMLAFMRLAWLTSSLGLLAGAVGATAEKEENIRNITYGYRQLNRHYEITEQTNDDNKNSTTKF